MGGMGLKGRDGKLLMGKEGKGRDGKGWDRMGGIGGMGRVGWDEKARDGRYEIGRGDRMRRKG